MPSSGIQPDLLVAARRSTLDIGDFMHAFQTANERAGRE
jgi:hypothetical protein